MINSSTEILAQRPAWIIISTVTRDENSELNLEE
jgi:hypothetical protein